MHTAVSQWCKHISWWFVYLWRNNLANNPSPLLLQCCLALVDVPKPVSGQESTWVWHVLPCFWEYHNKALYFVATWNFFFKCCFWKFPLDSTMLLPWPGLGVTQRILRCFTTGWADEWSTLHYWQLLNLLHLEPLSCSCLETDLLMHFLRVINNLFYIHRDL